MGTPVIGSTVKLTGKVMDESCGWFEVSFIGSCTSHRISSKTIVNAEIVVEFLKVGDKVVSHGQTLTFSGHHSYLSQALYNLRKL
jgi:hypothetical protein